MICFENWHFPRDSFVLVPAKKKKLLIRPGLIRTHGSCTLDVPLVLHLSANNTCRVIRELRYALRSADVPFATLDSKLFPSASPEGVGFFVWSFTFITLRCSGLDERL